MKGFDVIFTIPDNDKKYKAEIYKNDTKIKTIQFGNKNYE